MDTKTCEIWQGWHDAEDMECIMCDKKAKSVCKIFAMHLGMSEPEEILNIQDDELSLLDILGE